MNCRSKVIFRLPSTCSFLDIEIRSRLATHACDDRGPASVKNRCSVGTWPQHNGSTTMQQFCSTTLKPPEVRRNSEQVGTSSLRTCRHNHSHVHAALPTLTRTPALQPLPSCSNNNVTAPAAAIPCP